MSLCLCSWFRVGVCSVIWTGTSCGVISWSMLFLVSETYVSRVFVYNLCLCVCVRVLFVTVYVPCTLYMKKETSWSCSRWKLWCRRMVWLLGLQLYCAWIIMVWSWSLHCAMCLLWHACMYLHACAPSLCGSTTVEFTVLCILIMYIWLCAESEGVNLLICVCVACAQAHAILSKRA